MQGIENMVEVTLASNDDFLKVKETLTRIGIASRRDKKLYQSCHILHKKDRDLDKSRYFIVHFKELFKLDGKADTFTEEDQARRNTIVNLIVEWGLAKLVGEAPKPVMPLNKIKILPFKEKSEWELVAKYNIGKKKAVGVAGQ
jgi:Bacteriophage translational regulator